MSISNLCSTLWTTFYFGWFASEIYIAVATRTRRGNGSVRDRGTMLMLWVSMFSCISLGSWYGGSHGPNLPDTPAVLGMPWLRVASLLVLMAGLLLRWSAVLSLGKAFSANVAILDSHKVMKTGLYGWMRHPSYTGLLMCLLGVALHTRNWIAMLILFVPPTMALLYRIHVEEIALREHFGDEYVDYSRETKRLVPGIY
jgi:protein-S-isoprenylcysteine O-methyltransferase Ste14